jgi:hypothetical protein
MKWLGGGAAVDSETDTRVNPVVIPLIVDYFLGFEVGSLAEFLAVPARCAFLSDVSDQANRLSVKGIEGCIARVRCAAELDLEGSDQEECA